MSEGERALRREVGAIAATAIVVNSTIGTGIFKTPAQVARDAGSIGAATLVWVLGAVIALCGALALAELAAAMPRAGGIYEPLRRTYGPRVAFLYGWAKITLLVPSAVGSFAVLAAEAIGSLLDLPESATRDAVLAAVVIALVALSNALGVRAQAAQQIAITVVKYVGVSLLAIVGLCAALEPGASVPQPELAPDFALEPRVTGVFAALVAAMWAYDGWSDLAALGGEAREPARTLPRALVLGTVLVALVYLAANAGYFRVLGLEGLRRSTTGANMAAANLATLTMGPIGRRVLSALVLTSCVGGCMASLLTNPRTFVPMATDGVFVRWLGAVDARSGTPRNAVLTAAALGVLYVSYQGFEQLSDAFVVGYFPFYALAVAGLLILRRREPSLPRPFRTPAAPLVVALFLAGASAVIIGALTELSEIALLALGIVAAGVPLSFLWRARPPEKGR